MADTPLQVTGRQTKQEEAVSVAALLGDAAKRAVAAVQDYALLSGHAVANIFTSPHYVQDTLEQMDFIGAGSLPIIWDADFLYGPRTALGEDTYVLCEINVSSVFAIPDQAPAGQRPEGVREVGRPSLHPGEQVVDKRLVIILVIFLLGGFSGRFGGYGYGYGHGGMGVIGTVLVILLILFLLGRI